MPLREWELISLIPAVFISEQNLFYTVIVVVIPIRVDFMITYAKMSYMVPAPTRSGNDGELIRHPLWRAQKIGPGRSLWNPEQRTPAHERGRR